MKQILEVLLLICVPMCVAYYAYRMIDLSGKKSLFIAEKFPIVKRRFLFQVVGVFGFALVFGLFCALLSIPKEAFFVVIGIVAGLINSFSATVMYNTKK